MTLTSSGAAEARPVALMTMLPAAWAERWRERGADELVLHRVKADQVEAVLAAGERAWG